MSVTAGACMDSSAALLADPAKITYTYVFQLPYFKIAWDELQESLVANGIVDVDEVTSSPATITAGAKEWTSAPADLLFPITLWEKAVGASDTEYKEMDERIADPSESPESELGIWSFSEGVVKFRGATTDRVVTMRYQRELAAIVGDATVLPVLGVKNFLAFRTAGLIARVRGNRTRANDLDADAGKHHDDVISTKVKDEQGTPVRPKRYGYSRRMRRSSRLL